MLNQQNDAILANVSQAASAGGRDLSWKSPVQRARQHASRRSLPEFFLLHW
jgi:hypothetical protein